MTEDDDDSFTFGDFTFAPPSPSQPQPHVNGDVTSTSINTIKDDIFPNFVVTPQSTKPKSPIRADPSPNNFQKPRGALPLSLFGEPEEEEEEDDLSNNNGEINEKFGVINNGVLPKSNGVSSDLIVDDVNKIKNDIIINDDVNDDVNDDDDDDWDFKCAVSGNGVVEGDLKDGSVVSGSKAEPLSMFEQEKQAGQYASSFIDFKPGSISFTPQTSDLFAASDGNGPNHQSGDVFSASNESGSNHQPSNFFVTSFGNETNHQSSDFFSASNGNGSNHQSSDFFAASFGNETNHQSSDLFAASFGNEQNQQSSEFFAASFGNGENHQSSGLNVGYNSSTSSTNGFKWDPFPGAETNGSGMNTSSINQDDDFDDFGDFIDASQEILSKEQEQVAVQTDHAKAELPNGEVQQKQTQTGYSKGALPLSFFGDDTEEPSEDLDIENEVVHIATLLSENSFSRQGSVISINDLISNLYSQAQLTSSVNSTGPPAENGVKSPKKVIGTTSLVGDDDWDDDSWEFKGAALENGVSNQFSTCLSGAIAQKQPGIFPGLHEYEELYHQLRDYLCSLLSCQLDELKKARSSYTMTADGGNPETVDGDIQEAYKILEETQESANSKEDLQRDSSLNKLLEALRGPKLNVIESDYQLSKRLQLAANEWRVALELLRHAISMLKILTLGSADEQSFYASTWSKIMNVCVQELRHGASIWKRASEMNVQHQILSDFQGQQKLLALGEIYKVVKLLELSAKVYKPFILRSVPDSSSVFFGVLDECNVLWSNLGLEEGFKSLSNNVDFGFGETAEALIASIKNILDIDAVAMHGCVFIQQKSICQLSLLPHEMLADLKTVMWGEKAYFVNLANLWANLISCDPPQLPHIQVS